MNYDCQPPQLVLLNAQNIAELSDLKIFAVRTENISLSQLSSLVKSSGPVRSKTNKMDVFIIDVLAPGL